MRWSRVASKYLNYLVKLRENFGKLLPIIFVSIYLLFASGLTYLLVEPPIWLIPIGNRILFISPYIDFQTVIETIAVFVLMILGVVGLALINMGSKLTYDPKYASLLISIGSALFLASFLVLQYFVALKMNWI